MGAEPGLINTGEEGRILCTLSVQMCCVCKIEANYAWPYEIETEARQRANGYPDTGIL